MLCYIFSYGEIKVVPTSLQAKLGTKVVCKNYFLRKNLVFKKIIFYSDFNKCEIIIRIKYIRMEFHIFLMRQKLLK